MSKLTVRTIFNGAMNAKYEVSIPLNKKETEELKSALEVVRKYEKQALDATKVSRKTEAVVIDYLVKSNSVLISVEAGGFG